ncbi:MAG: hypothetical protein ABFD91_12125 [Anaerohalosphaeraceae bacterium]
MDRMDDMNDPCVAPLGLGVWGIAFRAFSRPAILGRPFGTEIK